MMKIYLNLSRRKEGAIVRGWWRWMRSWEGPFLMHTWWALWQMQYLKVQRCVQDPTWGVAFFVVEKSVFWNTLVQDPLSDYESDFSPELSFAKTTGWKKSEWVLGMNLPTIFMCYHQAQCDQVQAWRSIVMWNQKFQGWEFMFLKY